MASELNINSPLKFATFNCRGFQNQSKRRALIDRFKKDDFDFVALQETHALKDSMIREIQTQWPGPLHISPGTGRGKGLITLFNQKFLNNEVSNVYMNDRILASSISLDSEKLLVINVYAPCINQEKSMFFDNLNCHLNTHLKDYLHHHHILLGDLNIAREPLDIVAGAPHPSGVRASLNNCINGMGLVDAWRLLHPNEKTFTWSKTCKKPPKNWCNSARRLDYVFLSESLAPFTKFCNIKNFGFSDHRAVTAHLEFSAFKNGKGLYKLNTSLLKDHDYINIISQEINSTIEEYQSLNSHLLWDMVKLNIKETSQQYSRYKSRELFLAENSAKLKLSKLETLLIDSPHDANLNVQIDVCKKEFELFELQKARGAQVRSRIRYAEQGEKNTRFFLNMERFRSCSNTITKLTVSSGLTTSKENEILEEIRTKFMQRYNSSIPDYNNISDSMDDYIDSLNIPSLSQAEQTLCDEEITIEELEQAVNCMNSDSAPGADGLPAEFYKVFWSHLKSPLLKYLNYSLETHSLSPSGSLGIITLFHKGKDLRFDDLNNWRPLSLLNCDYKIIAKVLSRRLDNVIDKIIGDQQVGFMKGRDISMVHRRIDDLIELHKKKNLKGLIVALDFKQAFDAININCILKALEIYGFGNYFIRWIYTITSNRLACVKNGGHISEPFPMSNGVRQGCPISPQLFLLVVELLAQKLKQDANFQGLNPHNADTPTKIMQYCDDTSLFIKNLEDMQISINHLNGFSNFSDLFLNLNKSYSLSITGDHFDIGDINIQQRESVKILGITYSSALSACHIESNWRPKIDKVIRIFSLWSRRNLTIIGRLHIIKTFGLSQFVYVMKSIGIPMKALQEINTLFSTFSGKARVIQRNVCIRSKGL